MREAIKKLIAENEKEIERRLDQGLFDGYGTDAAVQSLEEQNKKLQAILDAHK